MKKKFHSDRMFDRVALHLRAHVRNTLAPGDKLPGIHVLAGELGVSEWTLRSAQALLAREGVLEVRHGSGVYVATQAGRRRVAIVSELDLLHPRASSYFAATVRELRRFFAERGVDSEFFMGATEPGTVNPQPACGRFTEEALARRLDGAVLVNEPDTEAWQAFLTACPVPLVGAGTDYCPGIDLRQMIVRGMDALAAQGGRRVAVLGWGQDNASDAFLAEAAVRAGMESRPRWISHDLHPQLHGAGWEELREIWCAFAEKPDSLLVTDDMLFADAVIALTELGVRVPHDLRVATHANAGAEPKAPFPVTLLRVDPIWCADRLGETLLRRMAGDPNASGAKMAPIEVVEACRASRGTTPSLAFGPPDGAQAVVRRLALLSSV
jgi:DNA-binding LacI/PurR family transcriptional regulator